MITAKKLIEIMKHIGIELNLYRDGDIDAYPEYGNKNTILGQILSRLDNLETFTKIHDHEVEYVKCDDSDNLAVN